MNIKMRRVEKRDKKRVETYIHLCIVYNIESSIYRGELGYIIINMNQ